MQNKGIGSIIAMIKSSVTCHVIVGGEVYLKATVNKPFKGHLLTEKN